MRQGPAAAILAWLVVLDAAVLGAAAPRPVVVAIGPERFDISGEGNAMTGLRRAPVPYSTVTEVATAVRQPEPLPAAVRITRGAPPQIIDYVWCVTEERLLVIGQQVRTLDPSGRYVFTEGDIKRAYPALEARVPWTWIVDIPLGREISVTLEVQAMTERWPVHAVSVVATVRP